MNANQHDSAQQAELNNLSGGLAEDSDQTLDMRDAFSAEAEEAPKAPARQARQSATDSQLDKSPLDSNSIADDGFAATSSEKYGVSDIFGDGLTGDLHYGQGQTLKAPPPRPGFIQRFVRFELKGGQPDRDHIAKMRAKGWFPRKASTITDKHHLPLTKIKTPTGVDHMILVAGQVLCEMSLKRAEELRQVQREATERQDAAQRQNYLSQGAQDGVPATYDSRQQVQVGQRPVTVAD